MVTGGTITIGRVVVEAEAEVAAAGEVVETIDTTIGAKGMIRIIGGSSRVESATIMTEATAAINTGATATIKGMTGTAIKGGEEGQIEDGETIRPTNLLRLRQQLRAAAAAAAGTRLLQTVFERD